MVLYAAFVAVELVIHALHRCKGRQYVLDLLQLAFSVVFTRLTYTHMTRRAGVTAPVKTNR